MELQKTPININFQGGLDLKTDPYQVRAGKFESLVNSVFNKLGRLTKRNGFPFLTPLPNDTSSYLTTFNDDLQAIGTNLYAYSSGQDSWIEKGSTYPIRLSTQTLIRNSTNQRQCDSVTAPNGLMCTVYTDQTPGSLGTPQYKYCVADSVTGQNVISPTVLSLATGAPKVFLLSNYFIIVFPISVSLGWISISTTSLIVSTGSPISSFAGVFDGVVANNFLYLAWNGASSSGIKMVQIASNLSIGNSISVDAGHSATSISIAADTTQGTPILWVSYYNTSGTVGYTLARDSNLNLILVDTQIIATSGPLDPGGSVLNITSAAQNGINTVFYEVDHNYSYDATIPTHFVDVNTITQAGGVGTPAVSARSIGLASKAFIIDGVIYYLATYQSPYQPTYFLMDGSTSTAENPIVVAKVAYGNGGGPYAAGIAYLPYGLPSVTVSGITASVPYLYKDLIEAANKDTSVASGTQVAGVYSQTGINLVTFNFETTGIQSTEIASNLHLTGGFLWHYDGYNPVEHNFFLWPDNVEVSSSGTSGSMTAQKYYYQVTYEWTDNQGNAYRSAPSIPVSVTLSSGTSVDVSIPYLRLTYKTANPVKIVVYRWSAAQQIYYQTTSITQPTLNSTTSDSVTINDKNSDATILGNNIIYTTGGTVENVNAPASSLMTLFDDRLWLIPSEDPNLLWFSKQVIESTPVEMSDLFTLYVAPSIGAQSNGTGPSTAISAMDEKLIVFKKDAIYYINGSGPDNTGNNNQYSQPIFITSTVGCDNPHSIAMIPSGLVFQSDKGIWLLGRDLSTQYIGAEVEAFNQYQVTSATAIPGTNQVRFSLNNGVMLMYDYFVNQWATFEGIPSVSSTIYQGFHTLVNKYGQVSQETPGMYLDGPNPVLQSIKTAWIQTAGLIGYQRAYFFYLLGTYLSPHKLQIEVAYDYNSSPIQSDLIVPPNYSLPYGEDPYFGSTTPFGGYGSIEYQRVFFEKQRCKAFQLSIAEVFDPSFGTIAGAGLTISGLTIMIGAKKAYAPIDAARSVG
jgi:hypothetical protein